MIWKKCVESRIITNFLGKEKLFSHFFFSSHNRQSRSMEKTIQILRMKNKKNKWRTVCTNASKLSERFYKINTWSLFYRRTNQQCLSCRSICIGESSFIGMAKRIFFLPRNEITLLEFCLETRMKKSTNGQNT